MATEADRQHVETRSDDPTVSRAELAIERDKVEIERERLALERERLASERERWKIDAELRSRGEGRGIAVSTLIYVAIICALVGGLTGVLSRAPRTATRDLNSESLKALMSRASTNAASRSDAPILLRAVDAGGGHGAYLLILD